LSNDSTQKTIGFEQGRKHPFPSFRRKPESRNPKKHWTPVFTGVTASCETVGIEKRNETFPDPHHCFRGDDFCYGFLRRVSRISCFVALGFLERIPAMRFAVNAAEMDVPA
jgi:hypothetical protein